MRKIVSALLATAICLGMSVTALAASGGYYYSSGGGGGGGGGTYIPLPGNSLSGGLGGSSAKAEVSTKEVSAAVAKAVQQAVQQGVAAGKVTMANVKAISADAIKAAGAAAAKAGGKVELRFDTVKNGAVVARIYVDPAKAANVSGDIKLGVETDNKATRQTFEKFFENEIAIASLEQKTGFGMNVEMAVKLDMSKLDTTKLAVFAYDSKTNSFAPVKDANPTVDANGYLHFATALGGDIIVTDKPLTLK